MKKNIKGIAFDMDNTILRSAIDFEAMKHETYQFLTSRGILPPQLDLANHTSSTIIKEAMGTHLMTEELMQEMWKIIKKLEMIGMLNAGLEPGVTELLRELQGKYCMVIVTNNSIEAAKIALRENNILNYFDCVVGREMMKSLKPSPDGFLFILDKYRHIPANEWISAGDAWVDGMASADAGIDFISYQGDGKKMNRMGVFPRADIQDIRELKDFL